MAATISSDAPAAVQPRVPTDVVLAAMLSVPGKVSDLIFSPGRPPQIELNGKLTGVEVPGLGLLTPDDTRAIADGLIGDNATAAQLLKSEGAADTSYGLPGVCRFRVNIFRQRGSVAIVMRVIPDSIPSFEDLKLPPALRQAADLKNGIVLVTGPTGSGKSSTLAAILDLINERHAYHIVTIEDPIEFMHRHKQSTIHQRELHTDTPSFALALRAALRQAPKVIMVGEMRDRETIEIAFEAAETGHLVFSTLHTIDAAKTVERILGVFPLSEQRVIRERLAMSFRWIVSQRLLPLKNGSGRVAAIEMLKSTLRTREYIQQGDSESKSLLDAIRDGAHEGMQHFDGEMEKLVRAGLIELDTALAFATNAGNLRLQLADLFEVEHARDAAQARRQVSAARAAAAQTPSAPRPLPDMTVPNDVAREQEDFLSDLRITVTDLLSGSDHEKDADVECALGKTRITPPEAEAFRAPYLGEDSFRGAFARMLVALVVLRARITMERESLHAHLGSEFLWQKHADRLRFLYAKASEAVTSARATVDMAEKRGLAERAKLGHAVLQSVEVLRVEIVADLSNLSSLEGA
jgi:twitching motility protein PilT